MLWQCSRKVDLPHVDGLLEADRVQVSAGTSLETLRPSEVVETRFVTLQLAQGVKWCEVQLFFGASPRQKYRWKALD